MRDQRVLDLPKDPSQTGSHRQILKSSALIGGSTVITIGIGIVRTKILAMLLGPGGFGLMGLYMSISDLVQSVATMGINNSGVRQIAAAVVSGDDAQIARTATVLRRASVILGLLGAVLLALFSRQISVWTFGTEQRAGAVTLLSAAVFFGTVKAGQLALIQGMRRIGDLARLGILGAIFGTLVSVPVVYLLGEQGVALALVIVAAMASLSSWWYSRKVKIAVPSMNAGEVRSEATALLKLGFAFMVSGLLTMGSAYVIRLIVVHKTGLDGAGFYQSAWILGGLYIGFILQAMGADFYPRLTGVAEDNQECNRLVNEQAHVGLLIAGPGVLATLTFAPLVVAMFYSAKFHAAVEVLRWICMGMTLRVITWPMGFIILAKGNQKLFLWAEVAWSLVHVGLAWVCVNAMGVTGAGVAFFGSYIFHWFLIYPMVNRLSSFRWETTTRHAFLRFLPIMLVVFAGFYMLSPWLAFGIGASAMIATGLYSARSILRLVPSQRLPASLLRVLKVMRVAPAD